MCGLVGLFDVKGSRPYPAALIRRMADSIAHRGPDGDGFHLVPGLALGFRRLAIVDLAGGGQPMHSPDGRHVVVFNGEIYNFRELRDELAATGAVFRTRSDTEVLLHGWRRWGEALLPRLRGMFALAMWDGRERTLTLARDPFGKKPLHYAELPDGTLAFASEIKALLCVAEVSRDLDPTAVEDFLAYGYVAEPKSIYRAIRKLEPGSVLVAQAGRATARRAFWSLLDGLAAPDDARGATLVDRLGAAVRKRMISDVPLGALLSGGVDSSAVVSLMSEAAPARLQTFSIGFSEAQYDESRHARSVAELCGADFTLRRTSHHDLGLLDRLAQVYDEPFGDASAIPTLMVCGHARESVTVALTGDGGDEVLAGYRRYAFHLAAERVRRGLPEPLRRAVFQPLALAYPRGAWLPRPLRAKSTFHEVSLAVSEAYARMVSALPEEVRAPLRTPDFSRALAGYDAAAVVRDAFDVDAPLDPLQRAQHADLKTYLSGDILTKLDRASMANSLELRSPMLDQDFAAWAFGLRPAQKLNRRRGGKAVLKRAMESRLPPELLYRPKQGFGVPLADWLRGPLRHQTSSLAQSSPLRDSGWLDLAHLQALAHGHLRGREDNSKPLWLAWVLNAFLAHKPPPGLGYA